MIAHEAKVIFQQKDAVGRWLAEHAGCEFVRLDIKPGGVIGSHSLDVPVTFYVMSGRGELYLEGQKEQVFAGDLVTVRPGTERMWRNEGHDDMTVLVIKHIGE